MDCRVLDLHGRRSDEAVRDLTLFLETIRLAAARVAAAPSSEFYVTVITGSGSHSSHGPILRSVIRRLLEKRGMTYSLERGGGAFRVNALSGCDLYQAEAPMDSKVVVADNESFHEMALAARRRNQQPGSFAETIGTSQQSTLSSSHRALHALSHRLSIPTAPTSALTPAYDPVPRQVAEDDTNLRTAVEASRNERDHEARLQIQHEEELERAISASKELVARKSSSEEEQNRLLRLVSERSIADEEVRKEQVQKEFEDELLKAIEQSLHLKNVKSEEDEEVIAEEEYLLQKVLAESEKVKTPEDELLQKILTQSLLEQKQIEEDEQKMLQQAINDSSFVANSSNSYDLSAEDEELRKVIEMSKNMF